MTYLKRFKNTTIGILGLGYIGNNLYKTLNKFSKKYNINIIKFNRSNLNRVNKYQFDYFFNCVGNTGDFRNKIIETIDANITLTSFLLKNLNVEKSLVCLSSSRVYGFKKNSLTTFDESFSEVSEHIRLDYIYNGSKKLMESMVINYSNRLNYKVIICRLSNIIGRFSKNNLNDNTFFKLMLKSSLSGKKIITKQNKNSSKDYLFIDDAIEGILRSASLSPKTDIYNIAYGKSFSIAEMAKILNADIAFAKPANQAIHSIITIEKARKNLNFFPKVKIDNLIRNKLAD